MRTLILFKPDALRRGLVGTILARFEARGFRVIALDVKKPSWELLAEHYREHRELAIFPLLLDVMTTGPLIACVLEGADEYTVEVTRALLGDFRDPKPGTIRGDYQTAPMENLAHVSSSAPAAMREVRLWFPDL